jgi:futalosine hydrolase
MFLACNVNHHNIYWCKYTKQKQALCFILAVKKKGMRVLMVVATEKEVELLIYELRMTNDDFMQMEQIVNRKSKIVNINQNLSILITGVGMVATAFALGRHLASNQYDLAVNLGIAGSFDRTIELGEILEITEDAFAELGAEDGDDFLAIDKLGFGTSVYKPTARLGDFSENFNLKTATAITVNKISGNEASINKVTERLNPQTESMEGAAFFYACNEMNVPCLQIRAVSNYVEKRNRDNWKMELAIKNLNTFATEFLKQLA